MHRLLLISCSQRKRRDAGYLPAMVRYDGPAYQVLRRYAQLYPHEMPDVYILSAQYGLIHGDTPIPLYDRLMTRARAQELRASVTAELQSLVLAEQYQQILLCASALYLSVLPSRNLETLSQSVATTSGNQGVQLSQLKSWLHRCMPLSVSTEEACDPDIPVRFRLKGNEYEIAPSTLTAVARDAPRCGMAKASRATAWRVLIDGQEIAPKWLISQLTGLSVGEFHSEAARRILRQMGYPSFMRVDSE